MQPNWTTNIPVANNALTRGTISRRCLAYCIDFVVIAVLTVLFHVAVVILGIVTFGLAFAMLALPGAFIAILYSALTISSPMQATFGMRAMGVRVVDAQTGGTVPMLNAAVHALLYYLAVATILLFLANAAIGVLRADGRFGHDLIAGVVAVRV